VKLRMTSGSTNAPRRFVSVTFVLDLAFLLFMSPRYFWLDGCMYSDRAMTRMNLLRRAHLRYRRRVDVLTLRRKGKSNRYLRSSATSYCTVSWAIVTSYIFMLHSSHQTKHSSLL
jgi:hypothetical protein